MSDTAMAGNPGGPREVNPMTLDIGQTPGKRPSWVNERPPIGSSEAENFVPGEATSDPRAGVVERGPIGSYSEPEKVDEVAGAGRVEPAEPTEPEAPTEPTPADDANDPSQPPTGPETDEAPVDGATTPDAPETTTPDDSVTPAEVPAAPAEVPAAPAETGPVTDFAQTPNVGGASL